jgi:hypothetical protein
MAAADSIRCLMAVPLCGRLQELQEITSIVLQQPASTSFFRLRRIEKHERGQTCAPIAACQRFSYSGWRALGLTLVSEISASSRTQPSLLFPRSRNFNDDIDVARLGGRGPPPEFPSRVPPILLPSPGSKEVLL